MKVLCALFCILRIAGAAYAADDNRMVKVYTLKNGSDVVALHTEILAADGKISYTVRDCNGKEWTFDSKQIAKLAEQPLARFIPAQPAQKPGGGNLMERRARPESILAIGRPECWDFETLVLGVNGFSPLGSKRSGVPSIVETIPVIGLRHQHNPDGAGRANDVHAGNVHAAKAGLNVEQAKQAAPVPHNPPAGRVAVPENHAATVHVIEPVVPPITPPSYVQPDLGAAQGKR